MFLRKTLMVFFCFTIGMLSAEIWTVNFTAGPVAFQENIPTINGFNKLQIPGLPILPAKSVLLALPPGAKIISVDVHFSPPEILSMRHLAIAPPSLPLSLDKEATNAAIERYESNRTFLESISGTFPNQPVYSSKLSAFRNIPFLRITYFPVLHAQNCLYFYPRCDVTINYQCEEAHSNLPNWVAKAAAHYFSNWYELKDYYTISAREDSFDYVIITKDNLFSAFDSLVAWKDSIGFNPKIVSIDSITAQYSGAQTADKMRNFLIDKYIPWGIHYVLIGGNVDQIPMKICYPDPAHSSDSYTPTDYYFAELTDNWNSDGDNYYGEFGQDSIGFIPEVIVGRIPYNELGSISSIAQKTINFERDTSTWKNRALLIASFNNFENEDGTGWPSCDGAALMEFMKDSLLADWTCTRGYEEAGLSPSIFAHEFAITQTNVVNEWSTGNYAVTNWSGHGNADGAYRKWWAWDDGDGVPEGFEMDGDPFIYITDAPSLDDDHPSIVFAASCSNAEGEENIARSLIGNGAAGIVAATTYGWYTPGWDDPTDGDVMSLDYYFYYYLIKQDERVGDALFDAKMYYFNYLYFPDPWAPDPAWSTQQNMLDYTLFGDPALIRKGINPAVAEKPSSEIGISTIAFYPNPMHSQGFINYSIPCDGTVKISLFNIAGQKIATLYDGKEKAGTHILPLKPINLSSGIYFINVEFDSANKKATEIIKIIIL